MTKGGSYQVLTNILLPWDKPGLLIVVHTKQIQNEDEWMKKVRKRAKIRNRYNQVTRLTKDTNEKVTNSQSDKILLYIEYAISGRLM